MYKCSRCSLKSEKKNIIKTHVRDLVCQNKKYPCPECLKLFTDKSTLNRHYKSIHNKTENPQVQVQKDTGEEAKVTYVPVNDAGEIINLKPFSHENLDEITDDYFRELLFFVSDENCNGIVKLFSHIHFNVNTPENANIYVSDISKKKIYYKTPCGFERVQGKKADLFLLRMIKKLGILIEAKYDEFMTSRGIERSIQLREHDVLYQSIVRMEDLIKRIKNGNITKDDYDFLYTVIDSNKDQIPLFFPIKCLN
jgi:hypothetical protein